MAEASCQQKNRSCRYEMQTKKLYDPLTRKLHYNFNQQMSGIDVTGKKASPQTVMKMIEEKFDPTQINYLMRYYNEPVRTVLKDSAIFPKETHIDILGRACEEGKTYTYVTVAYLLNNQNHEEMEYFFDGSSTELWRNARRDGKM